MPSVYFSDFWMCSIYDFTANCAFCHKFYHFFFFLIDFSSELQVHCIKAWDPGSRQWNVKLPDGESVENIAIGEAFVVIATSMRYFRTFSYGGTQKIIFCYSSRRFQRC